MKFKLLALLLLGIVALVPAGLAASDFAIDDVNFEDPVNPGTSMSLDITLQNTDARLDVENLVVKAWVEDQFGERVTDKATAGPMQVQQDSDKSLSLSVDLPSDMEAGEYTLMVTADGRWESTREKVYATKEALFDVEHLEDSLFVKEIRFSKSQYSASDTVDVAVTIANNGIDDQSNVKISIGAPELNVQKSVQLFGTLYADTEQTVYFTFDLPEDAGGIYTLRASASSGVAEASDSADFVVEESALTVEPVTSSTIVDLGDITVGDTKEFSLLIANNDAETKSYTVKSNSDWATVSKESFDLSPGTSAQLSVAVTPESPGKASITLTITEDGKASSVVNVQANATESTDSLTALVLGLIALLIIAVLYIELRGRKTQTLYY